MTLAIDCPLLAEAVEKLWEKDCASVFALAEIAQERVRQIEAEGWSPEHDDAHRSGEMADAASCYAMADPPIARRRRQKPLLWPWDIKWWKPRARHRNWVRAGDLLVAELARHLRSRSRHRGRDE